MIQGVLKSLRAASNRPTWPELGGYLGGSGRGVGAGVASVGAVVGNCRGCVRVNWRDETRGRDVVAVALRYVVALMRVTVVPCTYSKSPNH